MSAKALAPADVDARKYHHGDLRRALAEAALRIVERDGLAAQQDAALCRPHLELAHDVFSGQLRSVQPGCVSARPRTARNIIGESAGESDAWPFGGLRASGRVVQSRLR